ncbi:hypothetical protein ACLEJW_13065 [Pseudomonas sp. SMSB3]|nr:hypothetical protein [Pseudomonas sp.]
MFDDKSIFISAGIGSSGFASAEEIQCLEKSSVTWLGGVGSPRLPAGLAA